MTCNTIGCSVAKDSLAGVEAFTFLGLVDGRVSTLVVTFAPESYPTIVSLAREKWGAPTSSEIDTLTTRVGAKFPRQRLMWKMAEGTLHVDQYSDRISEGAILITSDSITAIESRRDSLRIKQAAKTSL